ncbi:hypothetical protein L207DRAFT_255341 [Hyaloscypha variabilis F]|uniref:Secreted protein n=1 Tax=Hyaloscypha variabilis (strain UAMH 11265 / GT02V1 / F) TaxID=1149755 RepID=A0A2J6S3L3_HYAVF|nr:hypothetical protein L207DRAFT_255341 [Hyaloscypha variabilis F]
MRLRSTLVLALAQGFLSSRLKFAFRDKPTVTGSGGFACFTRTSAEAPLALNSEPFRETIVLFKCLCIPYSLRAFRTALPSTSYLILSLSVSVSLSLSSRYLVH